MEADAEAFASLVSYDLKSHGYKPYDFLRNNSQFLDVHKAFDTVVRNSRFVSEQTLNKATRASFDTWFNLDMAGTHYETSVVQSFNRHVDDPGIKNHYNISYGYKEIDNDKASKIGFLSENNNYLDSTGGIDIFDNYYSGIILKENFDLINSIEDKMHKKKTEFCATRPKSEAKFCTPYLTKP